MPCYSPITAYRLENEYTVNGKRKIVFNYQPDAHEELRVPCGQCIGCRLESSRQWAIRCVHEAQMHEENAFLTLTFSPERHESETDEEFKLRRVTLIKTDFQKFMKRLREKIYREYGVRVSYYYCGEYGENYSRPHYHCCLFGFNFPDRKLWKNSNGNKLYTSDLLNGLWKYGYCIIGDLTFDSAAYVARYVTKKITGKTADESYCGRTPEFTDMSRNPAIGLRWLEKYHLDVYPSDEIIYNNKKLRPPKYYDRWLEKYHPEKYKTVLSSREDKLFDYLESNEDSVERLYAKYVCAQGNNKKLLRSYESEAFENGHHRFDYDKFITEYHKERIIMNRSQQKDKYENSNVRNL